MARKWGTAASWAVSRVAGCGLSQPPGTSPRLRHLFEDRLLADNTVRRERYLDVNRGTRQGGIVSPSRLQQRRPIAGRG